MITVERLGAQFTVVDGEDHLLDGTIEHFMEYEGPLDIVLDVGAHVGELAIAAAMRGARKVYAIEPDPTNFSRLVNNIQANDLSNIIIAMKVAVWCNETIGRTIRTMGYGNTGMRSMLFRDEVTVTEHPVKCLTLESLLDVVDEPVDYMKLDIEGAEHYVLAITPKEVLSKIKVLDLDLHDLADERFFALPDHMTVDQVMVFQRDTIKYLRQCGFDVPDILQGHALCRNEGVIRA